jgi:EthD domain
MFKMIALLKAREGLTRAQFIERYEAVHTVLVREVQPGIVGYRRNYVTHDWDMIEAGSTMDFDVVTEVVYADRAAFDAALNGNPGGMARLVEDEEQLFDRAKTRFFHVEERVTEI